VATDSSSVAVPFPPAMSLAAPIGVSDPLLPVVSLALLAFVRRVLFLPSLVHLLVFAMTLFLTNHSLVFCFWLAGHWFL
jgi:hypothetical protein